MTKNRNFYQKKWTERLGHCHCHGRLCKYER